MKFRILTLFTLLLIFTIPFLDVEARGGGRGGGGGGRGGGGGSRGGSISRGGGGSQSSSVSRGSNVNKGNYNRSYSRAPTMSRSEISRNRPSQMPSRTERPSFQQGQGVTNRQPVRPSQGSTGQGNLRQAERSFNQGALRDTARDNSKQFLRDAKNTSFDRGTLDQKKADFIANRGARDNQQRLDANNVRDRIKDNWRDSGNWFSSGFFDNHNYHPAYWNSNFNGWRAATWAGLTSWGGWGWGSPYYYDDGYYPIQVSDNSSTQPEYSTTPSTAVTGDWYPLGVFAVGKNEQLAANSFMFVQLAVNKTGDISGTYYNATTNQTHEIVGSVDMNSQQAAWQLADKENSPTMSTGMYNLTQDMTQVAVNFPDGTSQTATYVRMDK